MSNSDDVTPRSEWDAPYEFWRETRDGRSLGATVFMHFRLEAADGLGGRLHISFDACGAKFGEYARLVEFESLDIAVAYLSNRAARRIEHEYTQRWEAAQCACPN